jgi:hypothetical protein
MSDHLDFIRIRNLEDSDSEVFEGIGASGTSTGTGGTLPEKQAAYDLSKVWAAQQKFTATLMSYLNKLDPGQNGDAESLVSDYVNLLTAANGLDSSLTAYDLSTKAILELPVLWETLNRNPSKEMVQWMNEADTFSANLEQWFEDELTAQAAKQDAKDALAAATTDEERAAAQAAITAAATMETTADGELPATNPVNKIVAIIAIARALMAGQVMLAAIIAIRMGVPMLIDYLVKWVKGKLPNNNLTRADLQKLIEAVEALKYNDEEVDFGAFRMYLRSKIIES